MMTCRKTSLLVLTAWAIANNPAIAAMGDATQTLCADGTHTLCRTLPTDSGRYRHAQ